MITIEAKPSFAFTDATMSVHIWGDGDGARVSVATPTSVYEVPVELPENPTMAQVMSVIEQAVRQADMPHMPGWHEEVLPWGDA